MAIKIGHASIDERNKITGGQAGDSTGKEVCIRTWYNKNWDCVLRPKNKAKAEKMAIVCEQGCANNKIGYDQRQRNTLHTLAKANGYNLASVGLCECDCSSFMTVCAIAGGVTALEYTGNAPTTSTMRSKFSVTSDFEVLTDSKYLTSDSYLIRGDILVKAGSHTVMVLENGCKSSSANTPAVPTTQIGIDVSEYNKITDYAAVKSSGIKFAILKIMKKDSSIDKLFETHLSGFKGAGIPILGVYNYSYATSVNKAISDANKVVYYLKQYSLKTKVYLDVEDKCQAGLGSLLIDIINAYQEVIESSGYTFGLYTGMSFYNSYIKPYKANLKCSDEWIARYYNSYNQMLVSDSVDVSKKPNIGEYIEAWQYTSSGKVNGITGNVDLNIYYGNASNTTGESTINNIVTASPSLRVRTGAGTIYDQVGSLKKNSKVNITDYKNGWYKISNGWVSAEHIKTSMGEVVANVLNIRSGSGSSYTDIGDLHKGNIVLLLAESNGWYFVKYENLVGWCSGKYIKFRG